MLSDGYSVFQRNLQYLKEEIRENLLLCKSKMHGFTGLDVLSVLPVCFLPVVRLWAVRVSEGLSAYYYGSYGMLTTVLLFAATIGIYGLILWLFFLRSSERNCIWTDNGFLRHPGPAPCLLPRRSLLGNHAWADPCGPVWGWGNRASRPTSLCPV